MPPMPPPSPARPSAPAGPSGPKSAPIKPGARGMASAKSKTSNPQCSAAASAWQLARHGKPTGMPLTEAFKVLAQCRSQARGLSQASGMRAAGNEGKAQHLEHRVKQAQATGAPMTAKDRTARAKALVAARKVKTKQGVSTASPSLKEQVAAHRATKGKRSERLAGVAAKMKARSEAGSARFQQLRTDLMPEYSRLQAAAKNARGNKDKKRAALEAFESKHRPMINAADEQSRTNLNRIPKVMEEHRIARSMERGFNRSQAETRNDLADNLRWQRTREASAPNVTVGKTRKEWAAYERHTVYNGRLVNMSKDRSRAATYGAMMRNETHAGKMAANADRRMVVDKAKVAAEKAARQAKFEGDRLTGIKTDRAETRATPEARQAAMDAAAATRAKNTAGRFVRLKHELYSDRPGSPSRNRPALRQILANTLGRAHRQLVRTPEGQARITAQNTLATSRARGKMGLFGGQLPTERPYQAPRPMPKPSTPVKASGRAARLNQTVSEAGTKNINNGAFLIGRPEPGDTRPRNAFGVLSGGQGFGRQYSLHYHRKEQGKPTGTDERLTKAATLRVDRAFQRSPGLKDNFVTLEHIRKNMGGSRATQDAAIRRARLAGAYSADSHEGLHGSLTPGMKDAAINESGSRLVYLQSRSGAFGAPARGTGEGGTKVKLITSTPLKEQAAAHRATKGTAEERARRIANRLSQRAINLAGDRQVLKSAEMRHATAVKTRGPESLDAIRADIDRDGLTKMVHRKAVAQKRAKTIRDTYKLPRTLREQQQRKGK